MTDDPEFGRPLRVPRKDDLRRGRVLLVGALGLAATILVTVFGSTKPQVVYSRSVSQLAEKPILETTVRVEGFVVSGSLCKVPSKCDYRFRLADSTYPVDRPRHELEVRYEGCVIPDTFRDIPGYEFRVAATGELRNDLRHFDAAELMAMCPGKYEIPSGAAVHEALARPIPRCPSNSLDADVHPAPLSDPP